MGADGDEGRSAWTGGERGVDKERCRTLDMAARIVFGVSVMDRQIEDYLVDRRKLERGSYDHGKYVQKVRRMDFGARINIAKKYGMEDGGTLLGEIREVRTVRNAIAHSTEDVNAKGTVAIGSSRASKAARRKAEYDVGALSETLKKIERCNRRLSEAFGRSRKSRFAGGDAR